MAFDLQLFSGEKTEQPTSRRRQESRRKGQVVKSQEVTGAAVFVAVFVMLRLVLPHLYSEISGLFRHFLTAGGQPISEAYVAGLAAELAGFLARTALPILAVAFTVGALVNLAQVGFVFTPKPLVPDPNRINPLSGLQRMVSRRLLVDLVKALAKIAVIATVAVFTLSGQAEDFPGLMDRSLDEVFAIVGGTAWNVLWRSGLALMAIGAFDYFFQRSEHENKLKMTKQEVKQEFKETEGDPTVRSRVRQRQQQAARRRMMAAVPAADVVITNPTEYAIALKYEAEQMSAPVVVARGRGPVARRIREIAAEHHVPIIPDPPLARALYQAVDVGEAIPEQLFRAVAEVLALVYRLRQKRRGG